ncbi:hypothetical protein ES703_45221 [subsurface metagenome]
MGIHIMAPFYKLVMPEAKQAIFYPSLDGRVGFEAVGTWAEVRDGLGDHHEDVGNAMDVQIRTSAIANRFFNFYRMIFLFDISGLCPLTVRKATISLYGVIKSNNLVGNPAISIFESNPASNIALADADYSSLGTAPLANIISFASFVLLDMNVFTLNAAGRALLQAAANRDGIVKLGAREANYDAPDNEPAWHDGANPTSSFDVWTIEKGGIHRPYLTLDYVKLP